MLLTALAHFVHEAGACSLAARYPGPCPRHEPWLRWVRARARARSSPRLLCLPLPGSASRRLHPGPALEGEENNSN